VFFLSAGIAHKAGMFFWMLKNILIVKIEMSENHLFGFFKEWQYAGRRLTKRHSTIVCMFSWID